MARNSRAAHRQTSESENEENWPRARDCSCSQHVWLSLRFGRFLAGRSGGGQTSHFLLQAPRCQLMQPAQHTLNRAPVLLVLTALSSDLSAYAMMVLRASTQLFFMSAEGAANA